MSSLEFLLIFLIFLAVATIDLAVVLTIVLTAGSLLQGDVASGSGARPTQRVGVGSVGAGVGLRVAHS